MKNNVTTAVTAAIVTIAGIVLSGPVSLLLVTMRPQPPWVDADTFVRAYHPLQTLPYFTGLLLVGGALVLIAALRALAPEGLQGRATAALGFASAFAALIVLNYLIQTTFVPALVQAYARGDAPLLAALTLSNPRSLGWALEMWGYALLGVATWLVAPVLTGTSRLARVTVALFVANGPLSVVGALWTAFDPGWVMTPIGLALFGVWNLLMLVMIALAVPVLRARLAG